MALGPLSDLPQHAEGSKHHVAGKGFASWIALYRTIVPDTNPICPICGERRGFHGGSCGTHIVTSVGGNVKIYVTPTCNGCNKSRAPFRYSFKALLAYEHRTRECIGFARKVTSQLTELVSKATPSLDVQVQQFAGRTPPLFTTQRSIPVEPDNFEHVILDQWVALGYPTFASLAKTLNSSDTRVGNIIKGLANYPGAVEQARKYKMWVKGGKLGRI